MTYVVISLLASVLFLTAVGLLYAATGTVNLAELARVVPELHPGLRTALGLLLLVVFGIKAAIFPLFQWLPDSYPTAPSPVTALFAGLLTKVGVYAIIRTQTLLFPVDAGSSGLLLVVAGLTMTVGVLGAISQGEMKRILSFHIISQIGYMIMGLGLFTVAGVAGAVFYVVHHIIVKTSLFLVAGLVEHRYGTGRLRDVAGVMTTAPVVALLFAVPALSLAGIPPFSGFLAKLSLAQAGFADQQMVIVGISFLVGLLTLFSMTKIWTAVFWGEPREPAEEMSATGPAERRSLSLAATTATAVLVAASIGVAVAAEPLFTVSERAAAILLEPGPYLEAVGE